MIKELKTLEELKELYDKSAPTWEGIALEGLEEHLMTIDKNVRIAYIIGRKMNELCKLTGENAYNDDVYIIVLCDYSINQMDWKLRYGCRWLDDVINNNAYRERFNPFDEEGNCYDEENYN